MKDSRYVIGIDLGTTNCALAYVDTEESKPRTRVLSIPQKEITGGERELPVLPSFLFFPPESEGRAEVGQFAREQMGYLPGRVVHSAKSWLVHNGVDREAKLLPWGTDEIAEPQRLSPVEAEARYLARLKEHWDATIGMAGPEHRFDRQRVTVTVPASFDEVAQALTAKAETLAGFAGQASLLEEPQAAFYYWLEANSPEGSPSRAILELLPALRERPQMVLVCDIGGGTTDFSLFEVQPPGSVRARPEIRRTAVSDHILLGGDNIDLAIARELERQLVGPERRLKPKQWMFLAHEARRLKERVLGEGDDPGEVFHVAVPGEGASLFKSNLSTSITRERVQSIVIDGFYPLVEREDRPRRGAPALREWGLPFAPDSAVTRHLAHFLGGREVDAVLFTGGSLKPRFLRDRLVRQLAQWQRGKAPVALENPEMDLAVARGAAYYGAILHRPKARIRGGYAHTVYVEAEAVGAEPPTLVCVLPKGAEAGPTYKVKKRFKLLVDRPARFQIFTSNRREGDEIGDLVTLTGEEFHPLPSLQSELRLPSHVVRPKDGLIEVGLQATISETGLLRLFAVHQPDAGDEVRWQLEFNLRKAEGEATEALPSVPAELEVPEAKLQQALARIDLFYGPKRGEVKDTPKGLVRELEKLFHLDKENWSVPLLRALWPALSRGLNHRGRSPAHEQSWLYLAGLCLRPGYGADLDPWRMGELWKSFRSYVIFPGSTGNTIQWWVLWRRVAGGLDAQQQQAVLDRALPLLRKASVMPEVMLAVGAMERISAAAKEEAGDWILRQLVKHKTPAVEACLWALGRLANRAPIYAGAQAVMPPDRIVPWIYAVAELDLKGRSSPNQTLFLSQACRLTGDRNRDVLEEVRRMALARMEALGAPAAQTRLLREIVEVDQASQAQLFGEALPAGLKLT